MRGRAAPGQRRTRVERDAAGRGERCCEQDGWEIVYALSRRRPRAPRAPGRSRDPRHRRSGSRHRRARASRGDAVSSRTDARPAAPAKVNLFLHVTGRRADGYHLLRVAVRADRSRATR
ncbi:MAG: hypothetical protein MZW92_69030 [Comamonadaceae bacterium]|nr:hypothetical protein [Comamonadaceae bacterium]